MLTMKRTLIILFSFLFFSLSAQNQENTHLDSLLTLTNEYSEGKLVDLFIEIAKAQSINNNIEQAHRSIDEAIRLAKQIKYSEGVGKAYLTKGLICNLNNSALKAVEYFEESKKIFFQLEDRRSLALASMGLGESYGQQNYFDKANKAYGDAISFFDYIGDYKSLADAYYKSATTYKMTEDYRKALIAFKNAAETYELAKDDYGLHLTENSIAIIMYYLGDYKGAIDYWTKYEKAMREKEDWRRVSATLTNKGLIYNHWAAYDEALSLFNEALALVEKSGKSSNIAGIYNSIANAFQYSGNVEKSFEYYRKSIAIGEKLDSKQAVSIGLHNIGELHLNLGNSDSALFYVQKSLQIENTLFNNRGIAETKATLGKIYIALKRYRLAFSFLKQAEKAFDNIEDISGLADVYQKYGQAYAEIGNDSLTIYYLNKSTEIATKMNLKKMQVENHRFLSDYYEKVNNYKAALFHQKMFHQINDSIFTQKAIEKTVYNTIKLEKEVQDKKLVEMQHAQDVISYKNKIKNYIVYFTLFILFIVTTFFYLRFSSNKRSTIRLNDQYQMVLESEEKIRALIDASHDIVFLVDINGIIVSANSKAEKVLRNGNKLGGYDFKETVQPFFQNQFDPYITRILKKKNTQEFSLTSTTKRNYEITISPIFKHGIEISGLAVYIRDVTDILAARNEKNKLEKQLFQVQKLESIGTMAGGVAHDFNNYLGTILGYSSMGYEDSDDNSTAKRYFNQIILASRSAQHTVNKILTFSRKNEDKELERVNLVDVAKEAMAMVNSTKPPELTFKTDFSVDSIEILGNHTEMQQVFINLFNNAFHALEGETNGELICSLSNSLFKKEHQSIINNFNTNNIAAICVSDSGIGMTDEVLNRIFEPFFTTKIVGKGTGLGLSVVHGIIKNHKGELYVESTVGKGSAFYIYLPAIS
ncbi:MAG: hypothetical protein DRI74_00665 [Bacteroidetes bacterium]|nr:MAG: hypothetical protein DRI74_00665 [Bacteroidota bacterium]